MLHIEPAIDETSTPTEARRQLLALLADVFQIDLPTDVETITRASIAEWDSFNHLRLVLELEQVFGVTLGDEDVMVLSSFSAIEQLLRQRGVFGTTVEQI